MVSTCIYMYHDWNSHSILYVCHDMLLCCVCSPHVCIVCIPSCRTACMTACVYISMGALSKS